MKLLDNRFSRAWADKPFLYSNSLIKEQIFAKVLGISVLSMQGEHRLVGRDAVENYEREVQRSFPCCPLCGSKKLKPNLVPGGRDSLLCENCKAEWHLIIGLSGLKWAELERASVNGEGERYLGKRYERGQWQKLAEKVLNSQKSPAITKEVSQVIREKEIIREKEVIVKIRCSYCRNPYDETLDRCPHCGATA